MPTTAVQSLCSFRTSPEGKRTCAVVPDTFTNVAAAPAARQSRPGAPGRREMAWMGVAAGMECRGKVDPGTKAADLRSVSLSEAGMSLLLRLVLLSADDNPELKFLTMLPACKFWGARM